MSRFTVTPPSTCAPESVQNTSQQCPTPKTNDVRLILGHALSSETLYKIYDTYTYDKFASWRVTNMRLLKLCSIYIRKESEMRTKRFAKNISAPADDSFKKTRLQNALKWGEEGELGPYVGVIDVKNTFASKYIYVWARETLYLPLAPIGHVARVLLKHDVPEFPTKHVQFPCSREHIPVFLFN